VSCSVKYRHEREKGTCHREVRDPCNGTSTSSKQVRLERRHSCQRARVMTDVCFLCRPVKYQINVTDNSTCSTVLWYCTLIMQIIKFPIIIICDILNDDLVIFTTIVSIIFAFSAFDLNTVLVWMRCMLCVLWCVTGAVLVLWVNVCWSISNKPNYRAKGRVKYAERVRGVNKYKHRESCCIST